MIISRLKHPRTYHLPWSLGTTSDDRILRSVNHLNGKAVVVTVKLDGENCTCYHDNWHVRSTVGEPTRHPSRNRFIQLWNRIKLDIPEGYRFTFENVYAKHSIHYHNLKDYAYLLFGWNKDNKALSWEETKEWAELLEVPTPDVLYEGIWNEELIKTLYKPYHDDDELEGYVVRLADSFGYSEFSESVCKCVREKHVQTTEHWLRQPVIPNQLAINRNNI